MDIRPLECDYQKYLFLKEYNNRANMNVPLEYIFECDVYGCFIDGQLEGGFALAYGDDMAWPKVIQQSPDIFNHIPQAFCVELNLVWAKGKLHSSYRNMVRFWTSVTYIAGNQKNYDIVTYAVDTRRKYLTSMYKRLSIGKLYQGPVPKYPDREAIVFYSSSFRCRISKLICWKEFFIRFFRSNRRKSSTQSQTTCRPFILTKAEHTSD